MLYKINNWKRFKAENANRPKTAISLHSQSPGGSTVLSEDHNQTKPGKIRR